MYPVAFDEVNSTLTEPTNWDKTKHGDCLDLPVERGDGFCKSCWKLTFGEFFKLLFKRKIYLYIVSGNTQPPVKLVVE